MLCCAVLCWSTGLAAVDLDTRAPPPLAGAAPLCTATHLRRDLPLTTPVPGLAAHDVGAGTCHICAGTGRCVALRTSSTRAFTFGPRGGALPWASEACAPGMRWSPNGPDGSWTIRRADAATVLCHAKLSIYVTSAARAGRWLHSRLQRVPICDCAWRWYSQVSSRPHPSAAFFR